MRKIFVSFLGTNDYLPCTYQINGYEPVQGVRFVQEACIARWCGPWLADDRIYICVTDESYEKNWLDNGHKDRDGNIQTRQGLQTRLKALNLNVPFEVVKIPAGKSEDQIWQIFEQVFSLLNEKDNLYLDITHAFRSLPMLAMVILSYAKAMRSITVRAISYGAMEALGNLEKIRRMDIEDREVPVFDLLPFDRLQDWVIALDRFTATGDAAMIEHLADMDMRPLRKATKGQNTDAFTIKKLGQHLNAFSVGLATCRGLEISANVAAVKNSLQQIEDLNILKPLKPLLHKLETSLAAFPGEEVADGLAAVRWCLDHQLYQQGYTILQETLTTFVVNKVLGLDGRNQGDRDLVNQCVTIIKKNIPESEWLPPARDEKLKTRKMISWLKPQQDLVDNLRNLSDTRNDLNHAGHNDKPSKPKTLQKNLLGFVEEMGRICARHGNLSSQ
ncbi:TIGR02221 family CRISPR-associated protein [Desulfobulbus alkaliphilus]|uniref:TIGR02221 family CRISPR-associated protein n=1 Tax=Desulfobulbus alkaliphilus TaxID=869814 RepID=UPI0019655D71|nr:TIGR02221 family CRISPR-associated protein [Desulfobulbus alkaliphilus]MBM9536296.1 TIGR02221 family CRISPR-associated protein [Desulfobulbus alkaliphilus]